MTAFKLQGIVAAPMLPMHPDFSIDWDSLRSYIRWVADQRPTAIAMNMDASEGPSLERDEQIEVLHVCREVIAGAVPLVSGLIAGSTAAAVRWGNDLKRAGADALAVFPPFPTFLGNPVPSEMIYAFHKSIADGVGLPLIAFQFPKAFGPDFPPDALERLASIPQVIGLKEASFDTTKTVETIATARALPRKLGIMTGSDTFICEAMVMGCDGALIGFACTATAELIDMQRRVVAKDFSGAFAIWERPRMKEVLKLHGLIAHAAVRPPQLVIDESERAELKRLATLAGLLGGRVRQAALEGVAG